MTSSRISIQNLLNPTPVPSGSDSGGPVSSGLHTAAQGSNTQPERSILHRDYRLSHKTVLSTVYSYPVGSVLEYPETGEAEAVGHLFCIESSQWRSPSRDFAYARGAPRGHRDEVTVPLLLDSLTGETVPCILTHSTCMYLNL